MNKRMPQARLQKPTGPVSRYDKIIKDLDRAIDMKSLTNMQDMSLLLEQIRRLVVVLRRGMELSKEVESRLNGQATEVEAEADSLYLPVSQNLDGSITINQIPVGEASEAFPVKDVPKRKLNKLGLNTIAFGKDRSEGINWNCVVPNESGGIQISMLAVAGAQNCDNNVVFKLHYRQLYPNVSEWGSLVLPKLSMRPTNHSPLIKHVHRKLYRVFDPRLKQGALYQFQLSREPNAKEDTFAQDYEAVQTQIEFTA